MALAPWAQVPRNLVDRGQAFVDRLSGLPEVKLVNGAMYASGVLAVQIAATRTKSSSTVPDTRLYLRNSRDGSTIGGFELRPFDNSAGRGWTASVLLVEASTKFPDPVAIPTAIVTGGEWQLLIQTGDGPVSPLVAEFDAFRSSAETTRIEGPSTLDGTIKRLRIHDGHAFVEIDQPTVLLEANRIRNPLGLVEVTIRYIALEPRDSDHFYLRNRKSKSMLPLELTDRTPSEVTTRVPLAKFSQLIKSEEHGPAWDIVGEIGSARIRVGRRSTDIATLQRAHRFRGMPIELGPSPIILRPYFTLDSHLAFEVQDLLGDSA